MIKEEYEFWLANIYNIGNKKIELLLQVFESAEGIYHATLEDFEAFQKVCNTIRMRFTNNDIENLYNSRNSSKIQEAYARMTKNGTIFVTKQSEKYPDKLRDIYDAPFALYLKGQLPKKDEKVLAVVGARDCSPYGKEMARYMAGAIAKEGIAIVSGLARGIDAYAHEGTLQAGGTTYAVLGCGIDICYPKENIDLFMEMQKNGGVISEYGPGTKPLARNFPMRNRIISGLCDGILVIEAKGKSGSLITVDMGLEQGKDVFALPGKITDRLSEGCNNLIKMGAKLVTAPKDILEELLPSYHQKDEKHSGALILNPEEKTIYSCLSLEPMHIEEIAIATKLSINVILEQLLLMELRGLVRQTMNCYYLVHNL